MITDNGIIYAVIFSTLVILLLVAGVAITIFISNKQRITQEIKMTQMQLDFEKELRAVEHEVQEQVLTNVSQELHDNIGQLLTVMHIQLEQKKMMLPGTAEMLNPIHDTLSNTIQQVKLLGRSLNSDLLEQTGLLGMMQLEIDRVQQFKHFTLHWTTDNTEPSLSKDQRLMSFRIFQEILNNVLKHAQAKNIHISLTGKGRFTLQVHDDGRGFDVQKHLTEGTGSGLKNIIKRASLARLTCNIVAENGKGSTFTLSQNT